MYIVFIAGSMPTIFPIFKKTNPQFTKSSHRVNSRRGGDDRITLTSSLVPPGRTKAYAGRKAAGQINDGDSTEENWMANGNIMMTTNIDISRGEESVGFAQ